MRCLALLTAGFLGLAACREAGIDDPAFRGGDLLTVRPTAEHEQPGVLEPADENPWGSLGRFGWENKVRKRGIFEDDRIVWSRLPTAGLDLPAGEPRDRTIRLSLMGSFGSEKRKARVTLNGILLGEVELPEDESEVLLPAPAAAWKEGTNALEFSVDQLHELEDGSRVGVAVSRVEYDEAKRVEVDVHERRLVLADGTGVDYLLEEWTVMQLFLAGEAEGKGELEVLFERVDPATGEGLGDPLEFSLPLADQSTERGFAIPPAEGALLRLSLRWRGTGTFRFTRLERFEPEPAERTPIVLISIDTLAATHLSAYGYDRETTPNLAALAAEGVLFEHCITNAPWTLPSYLGLLSGLYPDSHRLYPADTKGGKVELWEMWYLAENRWTLPESLAALGYETAGFSDHLWLGERFGFTQGFHVFDSSAGAIPKEKRDGGIRHVTGLATRWLEARGGGSSFFLFLHAFDVHGPYTPHSPHRGKFRDDPAAQEETTALAGGVVNTYGIVQSYVARGEHPRGSIPPRMKTAPIVSAYDEGVLMVDAALGEFFDDLKRMGIFDEAIVVVTADHGETMDEGHYLFGHGVLDREVLEVPLIVRLPGGESGGLRVREPVQLVDVYPTLLDLAGAPQERAHLHGRSLAGYVRGTAPESRPTFSEGGLCRQSALVFNGWKVIESYPGLDSAESLLFTHPRAPEWLFEEIPRLENEGLTEDLFAEVRAREDFGELCHRLRQELEGPFYELYDLAQDPREDRNLAESNPEKLAEMLDLLSLERARREATRQLARPPDAPVVLSETEIERLKDLGYVGD